MFLVGRRDGSCTAVARGQRRACVRRWSNVAQEAPPPQVCSGGLIMCSQAGGSWEDLADEPPSPFTGSNVMRTRCRSASGSQSDGQEHFAASGHGETVWLEITPDEAGAPLTMSGATKDAAGCVTRTLPPRSPFLAPTTNLSIVKRGNQHGTLKIMMFVCHVCTCAYLVHVSKNNTRG